jgi:nucleoside-diphosphate-sugar epimerase
MQRIRSLDQSGDNRLKIVVTGGSGQLGRMVVSELSANGHDVLSLDRKPHPSGFKPSWTVDLLNPGSLYEACVGASGIVHLAAHIAPNLTTDCSTFNDNVGMTYNVLKVASDSNIRHVVLASSIGAYGFLYGLPDESPNYLPIDENHPCRPTDPYGLSKVVGDAIADSFALRDGIKIASLRFPGVNYDPEFRRIQDLMQDPAFRRPGFWSYIDVRDAAVSCRLAIEATFEGHRVFNVAAPTSNMREPTRELLQRFFPELKDIRSKQDGNWSGVDSGRAQRELGFRAAHTWERYVAGPAK